MEVLQGHVERHGRPLALYSDRHGIFSKNKDQSKDQQALPTQFERACLQLGIESILARSPQAKGRVERLFQTLQDRLVKALRLAGISDMEGANRYLLEHYIQEHNRRFAVQPRDKADAHRAYGGGAIELRRICARHHTRQLSSTLSCQFEGQIIQVLAHQDHAPKGRSQANIVQHTDGGLELLHLGKALAIQVFGGIQAMDIERIEDAKTINARLDEIVLKAKRDKECNTEHKRLHRLQAQMAHEAAQRKAGIYKPSHASELPRTRYRGKRELA
jgi:hypothetical protein